MRLLVCGGRDFSDRAAMWLRLDAIDLANCIDLLIQGDAPGADRIAKRWAILHGVPDWGFPAAWDDIHRPGARVKRTRSGKLYDADAGSIRNQRMLDEGVPTHILAAPGGYGTADMVDRAERSRILPIAWSDY